MNDRGSSVNTRGMGTHRTSSLQRRDGALGAVDTKSVLRTRRGEHHQRGRYVGY